MNIINSIFFKEPLSKGCLEGVLVGLVAYSFSLHILETVVGIGTFTSGALSSVLSFLILRKYGVFRILRDSVFSTILFFTAFSFAGRFLQPLLTL